MDDKDGGPAFPIPCGCDLDKCTCSNGMTLRDYFAGQALAGMTAGITRFLEPDNVVPPDTLIKNRPNDLSELAYLYADAMLKARSSDR